MIKYITELANDIAKSCPDLVENGCGNDNCVGCLAFKLIGLGYQKQEWISVDERLPERSTRVLAYSKKYNEADVYYYGGADEWWDNDGWASAKYYEITHWMPLPGAPKMKGVAERLKYDTKKIKSEDLS